MPKNIIRANISKLVDNRPTVVLDADAVSGAGSITVKSITGVTVNTLLLFRFPGNEYAEIVATHASTVPVGNTITLASALVESHPAGTTIYVINWNQLTFYKSATEADANADASSLSALASAQNIDPTTIDNLYTDTTVTSGYFYYRFSDSINSVNDIYSDPIPWGAQQIQFEENEVGFIMNFVKRKLGHDWDERFSKQTALDETNACLRYIQGKLKRWNRYLVPDYSVGITARGVFEVAMPADIYDPDSNASVIQVRLGTATIPLVPTDEKEFETQMFTAAHTTVRTQPSVGATTLNIVNSYDFPDSGSVNVYLADGTVNSITYTGVTRSATAGVLTGIPASGTGSISYAHAVGTNVWKDETEGQPLYFNCRADKMRWWPMANAEWSKKNIFMDYNQEVVKVDSESDTIDVLRYDMVKHWLLWQGKNYWRNNGKSDPQDADFAMFQDILKSAIRIAPANQKFKMRPKINNIDYLTRPRGKFETT